DLERGRPVYARVDDPGVDRRDPLSGRFVLAGDDLDDRLEPVFLVAGVDPFGRVTELEVNPLSEPGGLGEERPAEFAGEPRIDRRLETHDRTRPQPGSDERAGAFERRKVGPALGIDRRRHRDDEEARLAQRFRIGGEAEPRLTQRRSAHLAGYVLSV